MAKSELHACKEKAVGSRPSGLRRLEKSGCTVMIQNQCDLRKRPAQAHQAKSHHTTFHLSTVRPQRTCVLKMCYLTLRTIRHQHYHCGLVSKRGQPMTQSVPCHPWKQRQHLSAVAPSCPSGSSILFLQSRSRRSPVSGPCSCPGACAAWPPQSRRAFTRLSDRLVLQNTLPVLPAITRLWFVVKDSCVERLCVCTLPTSAFLLRFLGSIAWPFFRQATASSGLRGSAGCQRLRCQAVTREAAVRLGHVRHEVGADTGRRRGALGRGSSCVRTMFHGFTATVCVARTTLQPLLGRTVQFDSPWGPGSDGGHHLVGLRRPESARLFVGLRDSELAGQ